jgi:hypothetical protein
VSHQLGGYSISPGQVGPETTLPLYSLELINERKPVNFYIGAFVVWMLNLHITRAKKE